MKIDKIAVKKLFGIFDHEIPLNSKEHITIIHGPNGFGKTILLTLLNAVFKSQYFRLYFIPFGELSIYFSDKTRLCLKKEVTHAYGKRKKKVNGHKITIELHKSGSKLKVYQIDTREFLRSHLPMIKGDIPEPNELKYGTAVIRQPAVTYSARLNKIEDLLDHFEHRFQFLDQYLKIGDEPAWIKKIKDSVDINFIESQRLLTISDSYSGHEYEESPTMGPVVLEYSQELAKAIQSKLAGYGSLSQSLDRTFPARLVNGKSGNYPTIDELKEELKSLEEKRSRLIAAGLMEEEKETGFKDFQKIDGSNINVLSVYVGDTKRKLSIFDELTDRIDLLVKIINNRFLYKKLSISKKDGFVFKTIDGKILPPIALSSGEQHELVILYEMLFKVKADSLILIDEPELSLHVAWQQQFLEDLQQITKLVGFDVLIATHSPQIINDRWDLTVELKGPKQ
jgi:predicted ATP-binding protein involved in virulence